MPHICPAGMSPTFAVIGAGIAGASIAYHLARRSDARVLLFDRGNPGEATTARSVAQFAFYGDRTQYEMKRYGMAMYNRFFANPRRAIGHRFAGLLVAATDDADAERLAAAAAAGGEPQLGKTAGTGWERDQVTYFAGDEVTEHVLVPPLNVDAVAGAIYRPRLGYLNPPREISLEFVARAREHGAECRFNTAVDEIELDAGAVAAIVSDETIEVDAVIGAAGPWNPQVADLVDLEIPVRHTLAPVLRLEAPRPLRAGFPAISEFNAPWAIHSRDQETCLLGYNPGTAYEAAEQRDPASVSDTVPADIRSGMREAAARLTPSLAHGPCREEWVGVRSQTPDGNPIVGWTAIEGFHIAAFHTSGMQLAPAVGQMIARQVLDGEQTEWYDALSISRFDGYTDTVSSDPVG